MAHKLWTREELILAIRLYCELPFGKMHKGNPRVIELSQLIGRTPDAVTFKLVNFASLDPSLRERGVKGMGNRGKLDRVVWDEFYENWEARTEESERLLAKFQAEKQGNEEASEWRNLPAEGLEREQWVRQRVNQSFFRKAVLASYNYKCCVTGLKLPEVLIAGHIVPWAEDEKNRMNPRNGICINSLHDRAFEQGLVTITPEYKLLVSKALRSQKNEPVKEYFLKYDGKQIELPSRFLPDPNLLMKHNEKFQDQY